MTAKERRQLEVYIDSYYSSYFQMDSVYNEWASANGIQDTTLFVLNEISKQEFCTQRSLKDRLGYSKQTISCSLRRLEQDGLITRQRAIHDQRNNLIQLTPEGKRYADKLLSRLHEAELQAFRHLTEDECEWVLTAFQKLTSSLAESIKADISATSKSEDS